MTDLEYLRLLDTFFLPLSPEEAAERHRVLSGSGVFTPEMLARLFTETSLSETS